jgi:hypothetical protein
MQQARKQSNGVVRGYGESAREYALRVELAGERIRVAQVVAWKEANTGRLGFFGYELDEVLDAPIELLRKK